MTHTRRAEVVPLYHVPSSQVWEGSRGRQSGRVHLHVNGRALCGVRSPWYPRDPLISDQRCSRCEARAERNGIAWPLTAGDQGERPDGTGRVAPADGCAERQSTADPSPAASAEPDTPADSHRLDPPAPVDEQHPYWAAVMDEFGGAVS